MADLWELTKFVEAHPGNKEQRWRLVKKLYREGEYRLVIEHLQVLSNEWKDKSSIPRYLAATYMRLGRFDEAVGVLESAVETWPEDAKLWEQLALMCQSSGQKENAVVAWAAVFRLNPEHSFAEKAGKAIARQLKSEHSEKTASQPTGRVADSILCSHCGAKNTPEQLSCWKCKSSLDLVADIIGELSDEDPAPLNVFPPLAQISIVVGLLYGFYKTYAVFTFESSVEAVFTFPQTLYEVIAVDLIMTHIVLGVALLIAWPFLNQGAQYAAGIRRIQTDDSLMQSLVFGVGAYALSWVPGVGVSTWISIMLVFTLVVTIGAFWKEWKQAVQIWLLQCSFVAILLVTLLVAMHGSTMVRELPVIETFVQEHPAVSSLQFSGEAPFSEKFSWESTGSTWADGMVNIVGVRVLVESSSLNNGLKMELKNDDSVVIYQQIVDADTILYIEDVVFDKPYTFLFEADVPTSVSVTIEGVLPISHD